MELNLELKNSSKPTKVIYLVKRHVVLVVGYHVLELHLLCQIKMLIAKIHITLKEEVSDPQGMTVKSSLTRIGINNIHSVRIGKYIEVSLDTDSHKDAEDNVKTMCEELLANPVIEQYSFEIINV